MKRLGTPPSDKKMSKKSKKKKKKSKSKIHDFTSFGFGNDDEQVDEKPYQNTFADFTNFDDFGAEP